MDTNTLLIILIVFLIVFHPRRQRAKNPSLGQSVSIMSLDAMARPGELIKGGKHLEAIGKLRALAIDKTGIQALHKADVKKSSCLAVTIICRV
jgi:high-affinity K+ transport system ATPase subunit B